jgi:hypothetical protein
MISVKATKTGYFDLKRRHAGSTFEIPNEKLFSSSWMVKVGSPKEREYDQNVEDHDGFLSDDEPIAMSKRPVRVAANKKAERAKALKSTGDAEVI